MAVAEKTEDDGKYQHDCASDVGSTMSVAGLVLNDRNQHRKDGSGEQHASGIDAKAADPFFEVIAVRLENKPLVSEKREQIGRAHAELQSLRHLVCRLLL